MMTSNLTQNKYPHVNHTKTKMRGWQEVMSFSFLALYTLCVPCLQVLSVSMCVHVLFSLNYFNTKLLYIFALPHGGMMIFLWQFLMG